MTTTIDAHTGKPLSHLTFWGVVRSEWIKLRSLRSTVWCYAMLIVLTIGLGLLIALVVPSQAGADAQSARGLAVTVSTLGIRFSQLVVAVLGALVITGEYGTGMIRSTLTAVPKRTPALVAKVLVFGVTTFVVSVISIAATALITAPILGGRGVHFDLADSRILLPLLGGAGYLALLGMMSLALGAIIRSSAGGISASIGLVLIVPIILSIIGGVTRAVWPGNINALLPGDAGGKMYTYVTSPATPVVSGAIDLNAWQGTLVLFGWAVVLFVIAAVLLKRRDA